jgi:hypothetical protein
MSNRETGDKRNPNDQAYAERMAAEICKLGIKVPKTTTQQPSTQKLLAMTESELSQYRVRGDAEDWKRDRYTMRAITPDEFAVEQSRRKATKNTIGQSELSSATDDRKLSATHHFNVSPPAKLTAQEQLKLIQLQPIIEQPVLVAAAVEEVKPNWFMRLFKRVAIDEVPLSARNWKGWMRE